MRLGEGEGGGSHFIRLSGLSSKQGAGQIEEDYTPLLPLHRPIVDLEAASCRSSPVVPTPSSSLIVR